MNRGLLIKALRESWAVTLLIGIGLTVSEAAISYALVGFQDQISMFLTRVAFVQRMLQALLGANVAGGVGPELISCIAWVHLEVLALVWAHAIAHCTRIPAGEVDRGTIDVLLGLPVSRRQIYFAESLIWLASGAAILLFTLAGNILGRTILANGPELGAGRLAIILANLYCVYLAIGGLSWLVSSACDRRGRAVAVILTFVLASFLLNFVAQFWKAAEQVSFLSVLHYYNPLLIVRDGVWPLRDVLVLLLFGAASWVAGAVVFARRDVATL